MRREQIAMVKAWDAQQGRGVVERDGREDLEITREQLLDPADLHRGQRVAFSECYEERAPQRWDWVIHGLRAVSDEEAAAQGSIPVTRSQRGAG